MKTLSPVNCIHDQELLLLFRNTDAGVASDTRWLLVGTVSPHCTFRNTSTPLPHASRLTRVQAVAPPA